MCLNTIRSIRKKFFKEYGELVIACDLPNSWRKEYFPYYKANRKKEIDGSGLDWNSIHQFLNQIKAELKEYFPYPVIAVQGCEADDIIGYIARTRGELFGGENILIVSGDKDFIQLHQYGNVSQYDPTRAKKIQHNNPAVFLKEHIFKGDDGDGIPNVLSPDNCKVIKERQKPVTAKRMAEWINLSDQQLKAELGQYYTRNTTLIDLIHTPEKFFPLIEAELESQKGKDRKKLTGYFFANKLSNLINNLGDF